MHKMVFELNDYKYIPFLDNLFNGVNLRREDGNGKTLIYSGNNPEKDYGRFGTAFLTLRRNREFLKVCDKWLFQDYRNGELYSEEDALEEIRTAHGH